MAGIIILMTNAAFAIIILHPFYCLFSCLCSLVTLRKSVPESFKNSNAASFPKKKKYLFVLNIL